MTHRVGPKGQVVIPKGMREHLGIEPGSLVTFEVTEDGVVVRRARTAAELKGTYRTDHDVLAELEADKAAERAREDRPR